MGCACFLLAALLGAAGESPQVFTLSARVNVWDVETGDMNGDGRTDVLLLCSDEEAAPLDKEVLLFFADDAGGYPASPSATLPLPEMSGPVMLAECDGAPPKEAVVLDAYGAAVHGFRNGAFERTGEARFPSLLPCGSREPVFLKKAAVDLLGDGRDVWLIPSPSGLLLQRLDGPVATVACDVRSEIRRYESTHITHRLPAVHPFTLPGETTKALAFLSDEYADFASGAGWKETHRFKVPMTLEEKWDANTAMEDISGNGLPDLVVTQVKGTVNMVAKTHVYLAEKPFTYPETPAAEFTFKGGVSAPVLKDVDGDGRQDIVQISIPLGVANFINYFVRGKIAIHSEVYLFNGTDFGKKPTFSTNLTMDAPEGRERVAYTFGDFTGDGRLDVAYGKSAGTLVVRAGEEQQFLASKPCASVEVPSFGIAEPVSLNGNPAEDILLFHPGGKNAKRVDVVLF